MTDNASTNLAADYAAALDWWREAGVDLDYCDEPRRWLRDPDVQLEATPASRPPAAMARSAISGSAPALERALARDAGGAIGGDPAKWPGELATFREFWLTEPSLDPGALGERVAPLGEASAELMVLTGQPDEGDREAILSGEQGAVLARILRAFGIAESDTYLASALPRATPLPDWSDLATRGLSALTRHHIALAAPKRLIAFGRESAMLADGCAVPVLAAPRLETLARSVTHKRRFWNAWLDWTA